MGQKAQPLALRQASKYRKQDSLWYSRRYRDKLLLKNIFLKKYIDSISTQQQLPKPRLAVQYGHNASHIYAYICIPFTERREIAARCRVKPMSLPVPSQSKSMWAHTKKIDSGAYITCQSYKIKLEGLSESDLNLWQSTNISHKPETLLNNLTALAYNTKPQPSIYELENNWITNRIANHIEKSLDTPVYWYPVAVSSMWKDAGFLADEIVWFLERRVSFRLLKRALTRMVENMPNIQGVRVAVSGRVGGRSKKSQRARCDTWKYGATPLHVYSREIDYAQRVAHTPLGTSGVSVWLIQRA